MPTPVFMFPGQTSRDPRMLERILAAWKPGASMVEEASGRLGRDLRASLLADEAFSTNRDIQVSVFLTTHIHLMALAAHGITADRSLGLSMGEYNHLVHIGAIGFLEALALVDARGRLYDTAPPGKMMAIMPLTTAELAPYVEQLAGEGILNIANFNAPTQHVVAGEADLVDRLGNLVEEEAAAMCFPVDDRLAMHTHLMDDVAESFLTVLQQVKWHTPNYPYLPGIVEYLGATSFDFPSILKAHVNRPVSFCAGLAHLLAAMADAVLIEVGPRTTVSDLTRRWRKEPVFATDDPRGESAPIAAVLEGLRS